MKAKTIMIQGTGSGVGKSVIVAGLCRIFAEDGHYVAPFKAQNMALNSFVTSEGLEIGRAQAAQAEAAGLDPHVDMNPILLKPTGETGSQVVLMGKPFKTMSAKQYYLWKDRFMRVVTEAFGRLRFKYDVTVIEGAGSPAEINLADKDIVNMRVAELADAPVILVVDIDKGGAFAWVVGTLELLPEHQRKRVVGIIVNKFRGDVSILNPGLKTLEKKTGIKVLGVIPFSPLPLLDEEDSLALDQPTKSGPDDGEIDVVVMRLPRISNFTDFNPLASELGVRVRYARDVREFGNPDMVIIPGTKSTVDDLLFLRKSKLADSIMASAKVGRMVVGICGGFQMLGKVINDPHGVESKQKTVRGLELLPAITTFAKKKTTHQVKATSVADVPFLNRRAAIKGYEIHMGDTELAAGVSPAFCITQRSRKKVKIEDGAVANNGKVWGTYIHGIFDNSLLRRSLINDLRKEKGLSPIKKSDAASVGIKKREQLQRLSELMRKSLDMEFIYGLIGLSGGKK